MTASGRRGIGPALIMAMVVIRCPSEVMRRLMPEAVATV